MELRGQLGFDLRDDFAAFARLFERELAVLLAPGLVCLPACFVCLDLGFDAVHRFAEGGFGELAFPDDDDIPRERFEPLVVEDVALLVVGDLVCPEVDACFRHDELRAALVPVPEAAVDEDGSTIFRQHYIRSAGQVSHILSVSKTM